MLIKQYLRDNRRSVSRVIALLETSSMFKVIIDVVNTRLCKLLNHLGLRRKNVNNHRTFI